MLDAFKALRLLDRENGVSPRRVLVPDLQDAAELAASHLVNLHKFALEPAGLLFIRSLWQAA